MKTKDSWNISPIFSHFQYFHFKVTGVLFLIGQRMFFFSFREKQYLTCKRKVSICYYTLLNIYEYFGFKSLLQAIHSKYYVTFCYEFLFQQVEKKLLKSQDKPPRGEKSTRSCHPEVASKKITSKRWRGTFQIQNCVVHLAVMLIKSIHRQFILDYISSIIEHSKESKDQIDSSILACSGDEEEKPGPISHLVRSSNQLTSNAKLCLADCRSLRNKTADIVDYVTQDSKPDIFAFTERWLQQHDTIKVELCPHGYKLIDHTPEQKRGGETAPLCWEYFKLNLVDVGCKTWIFGVSYQILISTSYQTCDYISSSILKFNTRSAKVFFMLNFLANSHRESKKKMLVKV